MYISYGNGKRSGSKSLRQTMEPAAPLASGTTPVSAGSVTGNDTLNGLAVTTNNTNVTPITGPISVDATET
jgi:hypothetical protein